MPAKKPRKIINGIEHIQCSVPECKKWTPLLDRGVYRCHDCRAEYLKEYRERKAAGEFLDKDKIDQAEIDRQLEGKEIFTDKYKSCNQDQINALLLGDVELLLKTPVRPNPYDEVER